MYLQNQQELKRKAAMFITCEIELFFIFYLVRKKKIPKKNVDFLNVTPTGWTHRIPIKYANCTNANTDV